MVRRPTSITVIAVPQLVIGVLGAFNGLTGLIPRSAATEARRAEWRATHPTPVPTRFQQAKSVLNTVIAMVTGFYLLGGKNWSRILYLVWESFQLFYGFAARGVIRWSVIPALLVYGVITYFLFRPQANAFFAEGGAGLDEESRPSVRRLASIVFYVFSGTFFLLTYFLAFTAIQFGLVKSLMLCGGLLPAAMFLSIGRVLSPARDRAMEVGYVLLASAGVGAIGMLMLTLNSDFQKAIVAKNPDATVDYLTGSLWIGLIACFGGLSILASRRQSREKAVRAPIFGTSRPK